MLPYTVPGVTAIPVFAESDRIELAADSVSKVGETIYLKGDAEIKDSVRVLIADEIIFDRIDNTFEGVGNLRLYQQSFEIHSERIKIDRSGDTFIAHKAEYHVFSGQVGLTQDRQLLAFGSSQLIEKRDASLLLHNATFSNCKDDLLDIQLASGQIELDFETFQGKSRETALHLQGHEIIRIPTLQFPIGEHRQSGYLFPSAGHSDKFGGIVKIPYYYSLAPNYDATVSYNFYGHRGIQLDSEIRHLGKHSYTTIDSQILPDERKSDRSHLDSRYGIHLDSEWHDDTRFYSSVDMQWVSDKYYLRDYSGLFSDSSARHIKQSVKLTALGNHYSASFGADRYVLARTGVAIENQTQSRMPWFRFQGKYPFGHGVFLGLDASLDKFAHKTKLQGRRTHTDTFVEVQNEGRAGRFSVRVGSEALNYHLSNTTLKAMKGKQESTTKVAERQQVSNSYYVVDGRLFFDSAKNGATSWTIEPRIQLVGSKRIRQSKLPLFDTTAATFENYDDLFKTTPYVGTDRIRDVDKLSVGVSISDFNAADPQFQRRFGIGRIYYSKDKLPSLQRGKPNSRKSDVLFNAQFKDSDQLAHLNVIYNNQEANKVVQTHAMYTRAVGKRSEIGTVYRYLYDDDEQAGFIFNTTLGDRWEMNYRHAGSLDRNRSLESLLRFEYQSCCWTGGLQVAQEFDEPGKRDNSVQLYFRIDSFGSY